MSTQHATKGRGPRTAGDNARYSWPLHVIENARDDPAIEQPEAFVEALRTALDDSPWPAVTRTG